MRGNSVLQMKSSLSIATLCIFREEASLMHHNKVHRCVRSFLYIQYNSNSRCLRLFDHPPASRKTMPDCRIVEKMPIPFAAPHLCNPIPSASKSLAKKPSQKKNRKASQAHSSQRRTTQPTCAPARPAPPTTHQGPRYPRRAH